jgi:hypothetical protein
VTRYLWEFGNFVHPLFYLLNCDVSQVSRFGNSNRVLKNCEKYAYKLGGIFTPGNISLKREWMLQKSKQEHD